MATEFKILRGTKATLMDENGNALISGEKLQNGYWYLTEDTAEVYVCLNVGGQLVLKKINDCDVNTDFPGMESFEERLSALEAERTHVYGYKKFFPREGVRDHLYVAADEKCTYVYTAGKYLQIADQFDYTDHDNNDDTPDVRIIYGGGAE